VHRTDANGGFWAISRYEDVRWIGAPVPTRIIADLIELRETGRTNDLVSTLLDAEVDGEMPARDELINFLRLLLLAGNENTRNLIALGTLALINHPRSTTAAHRRPRPDPHRGGGDAALDHTGHPYDPAHPTRILRSPASNSSARWCACGRTWCPASSGCTSG
jgi:hypothetical protein